MKIVIDVTQRDINLGIPRSHMHCPISLAIDRRMKHPYKISVAYRSIGVWGPKVFDKEDTHYVALRVLIFLDDILPSICSDFQREYDSYNWQKLNQNPPQPFSFKLGIPENLTHYFKAPGQ